VSEALLGGKRIFAGIVDDISQRKRVETDLVTASEELQRANKAKDEFLSLVSHELNRIEPF
jgi:signal transduction histidine kinase